MKIAVILQPQKVKTDLNVPGFVKHIFTFICALLLAHVFVAGFHNEDMVFDPMDSEDSAVIKQNRNNKQDQAQYEDFSYAHRGVMGFYSEQKTGKKGKEAKFIVFKFISSGAPIVFSKVMHPSLVHKAQRQATYDYLYYQEINPPPPKFC